MQLKLHSFIETSPQLFYFLQEDKFSEAMVGKANNMLDRNSQLKHHPHPSHHGTLSIEAMFDHSIKDDPTKSEQSKGDSDSVNYFGESICGINTRSRKLSQFHANERSDVHSIVGGVEVRVT